MLGMVQLSPPYATVESKIKMAIGADTRNVRVDIFSGDEQEEVRVTVAASSKGRALTTLLRKCYDDIGTLVKVTVVDQRGTPFQPFEPKSAEDVVLLFQMAFTGNPFFCAVYIRDMSPLKTVHPVFRREIIQFYNDDLSDYYFNFNDVAANVFEDIIDIQLERVSIGYSTATVKASLAGEE